MRISVVIPTYQRRDLLARTLETLVGQAFPSDQYEIVVAVDGSTDGTVEMLRGLTPPCRLEVVVGPNRGPAAARNAALALATGELALFLDDDILCPSDLLASHAAAHDGPRPRIVFGPIEVASSSPSSLATEWTREHTRAYLDRLAVSPPDPALDAFVDANSSVPLASVRAVGGFDPALYRQCETADLALRLLEAGCELHWEPRAAVQHVFVKSAADVVADSAWQGRNELALCRRHPAVRTRSALGLLGEGGPTRRLLRRALASSPLDLDPPLSIATHALERLAERRAPMRLVTRRSAAPAPPLRLGEGRMRASPAEGAAPHHWTQSPERHAGQERGPSISLERSPASPLPLGEGQGEGVPGAGPQGPGQYTAAALALLRSRQGIAFYRAAVDQSGSWSALRRGFGQVLPVLLYHYVGPPPAGLAPSLVVSPAQFARDMALLARAGFTGVRAADWAVWRRDDTPLPAHPVLISFDDAYAALVEHAVPALQRHGFGATVFAVAGEIGGTNRWDRVDLQLMDAVALRSLASQGVEVGAHGWSHTALDQVSRDDLSRELVGARDHLADRIGAPVGAYAYPYGRTNPDWVGAVRDAFDLAFTTAPGLNALGSDPHLLRRTMVLPSDTPADLLARATLGWSPLERLRARLGALVA